MSTALINAIYARLVTEALTGEALTAPQALAALLATDPDTSKAAVKFGAKDDIAVFPCVTFRPAGGTPDASFRTATGVMGQPVIAFECWEQTGQSNLITDIAEYVERLGDVRRGSGAGLSLASGKCFHGEAVNDVQVIPGEEIDSWAGLQLYRFIEARY